jgi:predicted RND superfamily exporter protein
MTAQFFFRWVVDHPKRIIAAGFLLIIVMAGFLPQLTKDTRADAFLAADNPALVYREKVKQLFGLNDPMAIAVVAKDSIFTPQGLNTIALITESVAKLNNVDPDGITSLYRENNIVGSSDGLDVEPFYQDEIFQQTQANTVRDAIRQFPLYQGSLVAHDESASLIVAEILDDAQVEQTYLDILAMIEQLDISDELEIHVAGEGAVAGYMGSYIDADAKRLNPLAGLIITLIIFIAFLRIPTTLMANLIILASAVLTFGSMAAFGVPFYVITNALPVILIGIAVADSIHIYSEYFERRTFHPQEPAADSIVYALTEMWRPITLTTLTTAAGFLGLYASAYMPPFKAFGLFTAIGVGAAWLYSLTMLPAMMSLLKTEVHPKLAAKIKSSEQDNFAKLMIMLGKLSQNYSKSVVIISGLIISLGILATTYVQVDEDRINTFHPDEILYKADHAINSRFDGTNYLDIVIETPNVEGLFSTSVMTKIEALQTYAESLSPVQASISIVDYLKQMNRALNEGKPEQYVIPADNDLIAQYFLLYSTSSSPDDFEEEVDYDYQFANIRLMLNEGAFSKTKALVEKLNIYVEQHFNDASVKATLTGRVNLNYHWIKDIGVSHFSGMGIALFLVWLVSSLLFRSPVAGLYALIPVATSILLVYSAMVFFQIPLGVGTTMFAAVAIGLGVDFAIHTIDRIRSFYQQEPDMTLALKRFYPTTGRALFFNLLAIAFGFGVLISSKVVPLNNFGSIVAIAVVTSFLFSMVLLPAMILLFKPRFITANKDSLASDNTFSTSNLTVLSSIGLIALAASALTVSSDTLAADSAGDSDRANTNLPNGQWAAQKINQLDDGEHRVNFMDMKLTDRHGKVRERKTISYRKYFGDEKRTVLFYRSPRNIKNTGFLTYDYSDIKKDDDQWLYLPALRKARRISASDRGDYFLGTDATYEDIKLEGKLSLADFSYISLRIEAISLEERASYGLADKDYLVIEGKPLTPEAAQELGYGRSLNWVDQDSWIIVKGQLWDVNLNPLKDLYVSDIRQVDGYWTRHKLSILNHKSGHKTEFTFSEVDYKTPVKDSLFSRQALTRGVPK